MAILVQQVQLSYNVEDLVKGSSLNPFGVLHGDVWTFVTVWIVPAKAVELFTVSSKATILETRGCRKKYLMRRHISAATES